MLFSCVLLGFYFIDVYFASSFIIFYVLFVKKLLPIY